MLRPKVAETTAVGAAFMAGLKIGVYKSLKDISKNWHLDKKFSPRMKNIYRTKLIKVIKATKRSTAKLVKFRSKIISIKTPAR